MVTNFVNPTQSQSHGRLRPRVRDTGPAVGAGRGTSGHRANAHSERQAYINDCSTQDHTQGRVEGSTGPLQAHRRYRAKCPLPLLKPQIKGNCRDRRRPEGGDRPAAGGP